MELDDLKTQIKTKLEEGVPLQSSGDLEASIRKRTPSVTSSIRKNILYELAACLLCSVIAVRAWMVYTFLYIHFICAGTWTFCFIFCIYLYSLYKKILLYENTAGNIKERLQQLVVILTRFISLYFRISIGLLPVIFVFGLIAGYLDVLRQGVLNRFHWQKGILLYILLFMLWSVLIWFFSRWYIKKLYGNYLTQLQQQLKDIENG